VRGEGALFTLQIRVSQERRPELSALGALSADTDFHGHDPIQPAGRCTLSVSYSTGDPAELQAPSMTFCGGQGRDGYVDAEWTLTPLPDPEADVLVSFRWPNADVAGIIASFPGRLLTQSASRAELFHP
jgi:hypothetical protein